MPDGGRLAGCELVSRYEASQNVRLALSGQAEVSVGVVFAGRLDQSGQEAGLCPGQLTWGQVEIVGGRLHHPIGTVAKIGGVEVERQDGLFAEVLVQAEGYAYLSAAPARSEVPGA